MFAVNWNVKVSPTVALTVLALVKAGEVEVSTVAMNMPGLAPGLAKVMLS